MRPKIPVQSNFRAARNLGWAFLFFAILFFIGGAAMVLAPWMMQEDVKPMAVERIITSVGGAAVLALGTASYLGFRARRWGQKRLLIQIQIVFSGIGSLIFAANAIILGGTGFLWAPAFVLAATAAGWLTLFRNNAQKVRPPGINLKEFR